MRNARGLPVGSALAALAASGCVVSTPWPYFPATPPPPAAIPLPAQCCPRLLAPPGAEYAPAELAPADPLPPPTPAVAVPSLRAAEPVTPPAPVPAAPARRVPRAN